MELDYKYNNRWMDAFINDKLAIVFNPREGQGALNTFLECICDAFQVNHDCSFSINSDIAMAVYCAGILVDRVTGMETLQLMYARSAWYQTHGYILIHWREFVDMITNEQVVAMLAGSLSEENLEELL